ncbi:MAG: GH1 family beta-glucosidase [Nocardioides sp.]|uniref:GH1 family beta-glucosidase n=1 Tax=Nocardioides sp. TaxID=35761 RepID=UPI0039E62784
MARHLPLGPDLRFGAATASYQIEGATDVDGRGPSIWDTFARTPGAVRDGKDGRDAPDSYHRYAEDADLLRDLGVDYYRFSVAWPRIVPQGRGRIEPRGLDYYDRVVDAVLERGVTPTGTLYHWDLPQPLEDAGGWLTRDTAYAFADYAMVVHERLGDRVKVWATHNEPWCAAYLGYSAGVHAPGLRAGGRAHRAAHHLMLGHGLAAERLHAAGCEDVGIVLNLAPVWPESRDPALLEAADGVDAIRNRVWLGPLVDGAYDEGLLKVAPELSDPELVRDGDLGLVRGSADWLGINYYTPVRPGPAAPTLPGRETHPETGAYPGVAPVAFLVRDPRTDIGWEVEPVGLEELLVETHARTGLPLMVTENGAAYSSGVEDEDRIAYLEGHVAATERARVAGADVRAYIVWTLLDNFEWAEGYTQFFGIVAVDPVTKDRTPKASYHWLRQRLGG